MPLARRSPPPASAAPPAPVQPSASPRGGISRRPTVVTTEHVVTGELAAVINQIREVHAPSVIIRGSSAKKNFGRVASGILSLDLCLAGGLMLSRGNMIYGNRSAGKSTASCRFIAGVQRMFPDKYAVVVDFEGTFDTAWAVMNGVDLERLYIVEPPTGEAGIDMAHGLFCAEEVSMLVTDSIAMITPMKEIANSAEDMLPGIHARVIGNYIRRLNNAMLSERQRNHHPLLLHLNQWRMSIGVTFGDPRVLPGGRALEFSTSQQIEMSNTEHFSTDKDKSSGAPKLSKEEKAALKEQGVTANGEKLVMFNEHSFKITKDKTGGRIKDGRFKLIRDESMGLPVGYIDQSRSIVQHGLKRGVLSGAPNSFSHDDYRKWAGAGDFVKWLVENPEAERAIVGQIVETYREAWGVM